MYSTCCSYPLFLVTHFTVHISPPSSTKGRITRIFPLSPQGALPSTLNPLKCVTRLVTDQTVHYLGMRSGPDQTAIDLVVERLAAYVGVMPETDLVAAGYAVNQNLVAVDLLPGWRRGHSVVPEQDILAYHHIVG